jgi:ESCRT-II complex subunit VPS22
VSDFYYELAVQIIEICNSMQERTGGLIYLDQVLEKIKRVRNRFVNEVSLDDCRRAIKKLDVFGNAFTLIPMGNGRYVIQSLPDGMNNDHSQVLKLAETNNGLVTSRLLLDQLKWDLYRIESVLNFLIKEGIVWIDVHGQGGTIVTSYYFPGLFSL